MKYMVHLTNTTSTTITVDADDVDAAIDAAYDSDELPGDMCAHCSGWNQAWSRDEGEWQAVEVVDETDKIVWSDRGGPDATNS